MDDDLPSTTTGTTATRPTETSRAWLWGWLSLSGPVLLVVAAVVATVTMSGSSFSSLGILLEIWATACVVLAVAAVVRGLRDVGAGTVPSRRFARAGVALGGAGLALGLLWLAVLGLTLLASSSF